MKRLYMFFVSMSAILSLNAQESFMIDSMQYYLEYPAATNVKALEYIGHSPNVTIPSSVSYYGHTYSVSEIASFCFNNKSILSVVIPNSVTKIGAYCFAGCNGLTTCIIPSSVTELGNGCFRWSGLTSITIPPSITYLPYECFRHCTSLTSIDMQYVEYVGDECFRECTSLTSVYLPNGRPAEQSFMDCTGLFSVDVAGPIKNECFKNCTSLRSASFNTRISGGSNGDVGVQAFYGCSNLQTVNIGLSYAVLLDAFWGCNSIDTIIVLSSEPPYGSTYYGYPDPTPQEIWQDVDFHTTVIVVPCGMKNEYEQSYIWGQFWNIVEDSSTCGFEIIVESSDLSMGTVTGSGNYGDGETIEIRAIPNSGYHFECWQDGNTDNPRTITITGDATYIAYFAPNTQGIDELNDKVNIYANNGCIVIDCVDVDDMIAITDVKGRQLYFGINQKTYSVPATGLYFVKVGNRPAKKVIVKR